MVLLYSIWDFFTILTFCCVNKLSTVLCLHYILGMLLYVGKRQSDSYLTNNNMIKLTNNWEGRNYMKYQRDLKTGQFKNKVKSFFKKLVFWFVVVCMLAGVVQYFRWAYPTTITKEVVKEVLINQEIDYPVLDRIAQCESGNKHLGPSGQVLVVGNTNKSVDIGKFQINNAIWGKKATELGLNLMVEKDNEEFANYLYKTYGTEPWVWSKKCWNK